LGKPFDLEKTPFEVFERRHSSLNRSLDVCSETLTAARGETITRRDIENGLITVVHLDEVFDLLRQDITSEEILALLAGVDFRHLCSVTLCEISVDESFLPDGLPLHHLEAEVKLNGKNWTIHKYDADPFPSNPHAHNYALNLKLHLGNGMLYSGTERKSSCGKMSKKDLVKLRGLVQQRNATIVLPELTL
jgi:hypothetical protein